jgi:ribosomal protein S14
MAKTSIIYREMRRKYPNQVRNRCQLCGGRVVIFDALVYAAFAFVS